MELQSLFHTYKTAIYEKDVEAYASIFDEDVIIFDTWQNWSYQGLKVWCEIAKAWFHSLGTNKDVVSYDDIKIHDNGDLAIMTGIVKFTAVSEEGEELRFLENRLTWIAKQTNQGWKIIHQHTSSPVDLQTMKVRLTR